MTLISGMVGEDHFQIRRQKKCIVGVRLNKKIVVNPDL
jgi:hypothetical protein